MMITIYCSERLDGLASAAIIARHAKLTNLPVHFGGFLHPETLSEELEDIAKNERQLLFILDMSISPEHTQLIEKILQKNKIVYWNTHDPQAVVPPAKIFDKGDKKCSAELSMQRFLPHDLIAKHLAQLAHDVEFWQLEDERATKLADLIMAQYSPLELMDALSRGIFWSVQFETSHREYIQKKTAAIEELLKSLIVKPYLSYRFGYAIASSVLATAEACQKVLDGHAGVDVAIALYRNGKIAFRKRDECDIDVSQLAQLFGGGGHPYAAGAKLSTTVSKENFEDVIFQLDNAFKSFFIKIPNV
jgi:oligoribonuclease NrnB/cAMP/cGMP phosphodiesterase (DHH superfamily)